MNCSTKFLLNQKLRHHNLNLYYPCGFSVEAETNCRIEQTISYFLNNYGKLAETHTFVLEYHDDVISAVCYRLLKVISAVLPNELNIVLYGRRRKTKEMVKGAKKISKFKLKRLKDYVYVSPFNPLYKVAGIDDIFKKLPTGIPLWFPMESFTPEQLKVLRLFYHVDYISNDIIEDKELTEQFDRWCCGAITSWLDNDFKFNDNLIDEYTETDIKIIYLTSDLEKNELLLREIEDTDSIVLYHFPDDINSKEHQMIIDQLKQYALFIKRHSNAIGNLNILNEIIIPIEDFIEFFNCNITEIKESPIE